MKSTSKQLFLRGFLDKGLEQNYQHLSFEQRTILLKSKIPAERTLAARLLEGNKDLSAINHLIDALRTEKKLYTKIEICNSLASFRKEAVLPLTNALGNIGNNQHRIVPDAGFKKNSYPLPRDIVARTLARIGSIALPDLIMVLESNNYNKICEAIDAIGFICFYKSQPDVFKHLEACFYRNENNDLLKWKIFRAMSAFAESESFLKGQMAENRYSILVPEIERSLRLIKMAAESSK
jgi:hypothetical protein